MKLMPGGFFRASAFLFHDSLGYDKCDYMRGEDSAVPIRKNNI